MSLLPRPCNVLMVYPRFGEGTFWNFAAACELFGARYPTAPLGLITVAALARPERLTVAALGDGGALMAASELETVVRLGLPMLIVVYDDEAYGAEVHHFGPDGHPLGTVRFPPADLAEIGRGFGDPQTPGDVQVDIPVTKSKPATGF